MRALSHALGAALLAEPMSARPVRPALVVRCGPARVRTTEPIRFDAGEAATAWIADLRAAQAVR